MTQPIEEGMVLGGRYLVTGHVLTSADQDMVLDGRDQVLNRDVAILVASQEHASQVAASARELATGERQGTVQVLDLGLSEGRTYLIAGGSPAAEELLDLTRDQQVYVEPFHTDTLGSEIFGEARTYEPQVYEDDEEYYEDLEDGLADPEQEKRRPKFLRGISERLSQRVGSDDAATNAVAGGAVAGAAGAAAASSSRSEHDAGPAGDADPAPAAVRREDERPLPETVSDDEWTDAHDAVVVDRQDPTADTPTVAESSAPSDTQADRDDQPEQDDRDAATPGSEESAAQESGPDGSAPEETAAVDATEVGRHGPGTGRDQRDHPDRPKVTLWEDDAPDTTTEADRGGRRTGAAAAGAAAAGVGGVAAAGSAGAASGSGAASGASTGGASSAASSTSSSAAAYDGHYHEYDEDAEFDEFLDEDEEEKPSGARWLVGGILVLLLILGAVFTFNILGNNRDPQAGGEASTPGEPSGSSSESAPEPTSDLPEPAIVGATRLVPDSPDLSAETDNTLPNAVDGNPATAWQPYSFAQPAFGGYASNMALVIELEEPSAITQVDIAQNNGSGGSFSVLLNDSPSLDGARQIAEGSFTGPEISVPVPATDSGPAEAQYVIINFTELPQLSNASANLPYGLRIAEVTVE